MSDFAKTIIAVLLTAALSSIATTARISSDIAAIDKTVVRIERKLELFDDRLRAVEIGQAGFLASN